MTRDDIIRMAKEVGIRLMGDGFGKPDRTDVWATQDEFECFANLVAAAEREAIAQMIEDAPPLVNFATNALDGCIVCGFTPKLAAKTIRERK